MTAILNQFIGAGILGELGSVGTTGTNALDSQNKAVFGTFAIPVDDTITHVGFVNNSKTGTPANDSYTISIQGLTSSGVPDGTPIASQTFPNATYPASGFGSGTSHIIQLSSSVALQGGTQYALVVQRTGATDASNYLTVRYGATTGGVAGRLPYAGTADATPTWTKVATWPFYWLVRSASRTYGWPFINLAAGKAIGTTTEVGGTFTLPSAFGIANTYGIRGVRMLQGSPGMTGGGTFTCNLYSSPTSGSPTILQTTGQLDSDIFASTSANGVVDIMFPEDTLAALVPGTKYGIGFSSSQASSWSLRNYTLIDAGSRDALPMGGITLATRTLASAYPPDNSDGVFSETATTVGAIDLILGDFTASSSGGLLTHPGMSGGMRG